MSDLKFKEEKFPTNSFIGGWYMDEEICDKLINYYKSNPNLQFDGVVASEIRPKEKLSKDISIQMHIPFLGIEIFDDYLQKLFKIVKLYEKKYTEYGLMDYYGICEEFNIQHYKPGEGFYKWHAERMTHRNRCLVFMTYLNDVPNAGTEFKYQKLKTECKKGLTLIWPTDVTHTHRGIISKEHDKYIVTGWFGFVNYVDKGRLT
jgi:prolyl 4-hydroxylase